MAMLRYGTLEPKILPGLEYESCAVLYALFRPENRKDPVMQ